MKIIQKIICAVFLWGFGLEVQAQNTSDSFYVAPIHTERIQITTSEITTVLFPVKIIPAGKGSLDIKAHRVSGMENVLMIQAMRENFPSTDLTVVGSNGELYSFILEYVPSPKVLNYRIMEPGYGIPEQGFYRAQHAVIFSGMPVDGTTLASDADSVLTKPTFIRATTSSERMTLNLKSIYLKDSLMWLRLGVKNRSHIEYKRDFLNISLLDNTRAKRTASQERQMEPVFCTSNGNVPGMAKGDIVVGLRPFTVPKHKSLVVQISEANGGRPLALRVGRKTVLKAKVF